MQKNELNQNTKRGLFPLAAGAFALGIAEFGMMGILGDVAKDIGVSITEGGHLISAYSIGVAIGAVLLVFMNRMQLKNLLLLLAAMIAIGNIMATVSQSFSMLIVSRFLSGLPHGAFFGTGAIVCSRLSSPGHGAAAVSIMVSGMTIANLAGVPAATFLCNLLSWRLVFGIVAFTGILTALGIYLWIPKLQSDTYTGIKGQFSFLKSSSPWLIYAGVFFGQASVYCWFSYIDPIMTGVTRFSSSDMSWIMMVAGAGMVVGNAVSGKLADRYGAARVSGMFAAAMVLVMPMLYFLSEMKIVSVILMFVATCSLFAIGGPLQYLIVRYAKGGEMLGGAGIQIAFNVSNAVSATLGGIAINHGLGLASPALVGVPFAIIGAVSLFILNRRCGMHHA